MRQKSISWHILELTCLNMVYTRIYCYKPVHTEHLQDFVEHIEMQGWRRARGPQCHPVTLRGGVPIHALRMMSFFLYRMLRAWKGQLTSVWRVWKDRNAVALHSFTDSFLAFLCLCRRKLAGVAASLIAMLRDPAFDSKDVPVWTEYTQIIISIQFLDFWLQITMSCHGTSMRLLCVHIQTLENHPKMWQISVSMKSPIQQYTRYNLVYTSMKCSYRYYIPRCT